MSVHCQARLHASETERHAQTVALWEPHVFSACMLHCCVTLSVIMHGNQSIHRWRIITDRSIDVECHPVRSGYLRCTRSDRKLYRVYARATQACMHAGCPSTCQCLLPRHPCFLALPTSSRLAAAGRAWIRCSRVNQPTRCMREHARSTMRAGIRSMIHCLCSESWAKGSKN
jgi:hypothetical protein